MRVLMYGFGSRGDVQPLIALGRGLQGAGYTVSLAAGKNFEGWVKEYGLGFEPIPVDVEALMQSDVGTAWSDGSSHNGRAELQNMKRMVEVAGPPVGEMVTGLIDKYDTFISGVLTVELFATVAAVCGKKHVIGLLAPWAPTRRGAAGLQAPLPHADSLINYGMGYMIEMLMAGVLRAPSVELRERLKLPKPTTRGFMRAWNQTPTLTGVSPLVTPPAPDWGKHIHVTGYWFLDAPEGYAPPPALQAFLDAGAPPVYIGFGSMGSSDPEGTLKVMLGALEKSGQRGVIHSGWAGLAADKLPANVFLLNGVPHDWLFPRMAAVVHHGGAGTTGAGLRAGVPSMAVPHLGDQVYWGRRIHELGAGAAPIRRHLLTAETLGGAISQMVTDGDMRTRAAALGERIRAEDGVGNAVRAFKAMVG